MNRPTLCILVIAILTAWLVTGAPARARLAEVGEPVTVALPEGVGSALFSNNSAAAVDDEGNIGIAYTVRDEGDRQILDVFTPDGEIARYEAPSLPYTWRNTPVVKAAPENFFVFTRFTPGDDEMPDLATDIFSIQETGAKKLATETKLSVREALRLKLAELGCTPIGHKYIERSYSPSIGAEGAQAWRLPIPTTTVPVGDYYIVLCSDGRKLTLHPRRSPPSNFDFIVFPVPPGESAAKTTDTVAPPVSVPILAGGSNSRGNMLAYYGEPISGDGVALITIIERNSNLDVTNVIQIEEPAPSLFPGPVLATCGHIDYPHYWVAFTDDQTQTVVARIEDGVVELIDLGASNGSLDITCDGWGNALVSWLGTNADFDFFIRTRVLGPDGSEIAAHDQPLPPEQFPNPQFAIVSNDINEAGDVVVAWSNGGFGVFFQRYKLSGHFAIDGTLSGSHFSPAFNGEGFVFDIVEINGVPTLALYYFTYQPDGSGRMAWLVGSGPIIDNRAVAEVVAGSGATFGAAFDPADVELPVVGTVTVTYLSCGLALVETDSEQFGPQAYVAGRLTGRALEVDGQCGKGPNGTPMVDASRGGSHFTPARNGEGFIFDVVRIDGQPTLVIYYFTYRPDGSGDAAWLVGSGPIQGNKAITNVVFGSGGVFGPGFDPSLVTFTEWGTITVTWLTCAEVLIEYNGLWGSGSFTVGRLTPVLIGAMGVCAS